MESIIELGDIIKIVSPINPSFHESTFYVTYCDYIGVITIVHIATFEKYTIHLSLDDTIEEIKILSKSSEKGFAKQNELLPNTWVEIHFSGDIPSIVVAQILQLNEDMITLQSHPENVIFYLDFEYKGIPVHIPISKICIRDKPITFQQETTEPEEIEEGEDETLLMEYDDKGDVVIHLVDNATIEDNMNDTLHTLFLKNNVEEEEETFKPKQNLRYKLETQVNDLLDFFLAGVSDDNRTTKRLRTIYTHIQRYKELYEMFSLFDEYHQIVGYRKKKPLTHKPLVDVLYQTKRVPWIIPIVSHAKKIYDQKPSEPFFDCIMGNSQKTLEDEEEIYKQVVQANYDHNTRTKYKEYYFQLNSFLRPFQNNWSTPNTITHVEVNEDVDVIVSNKKELVSSCINHDVLKEGRFLISRYNTNSDYPVYNKKTKETTFSTLFEKDNMSIQSFIILPKQFIEYAKMYLPSSDILLKSKLSSQSILWPLKKIQKEELFIQEKEDVQNNIFFNSEQVRHVKLSPFNEFLEGKTENEKFQLFLQQMIPNIFATIEHCANDKSIYSTSSFMKKLESFFIYKNDLSFKALETIKFHIRNNITSFFNRYELSIRSYAAFANVTFPVPHKKLSSVYSTIEQLFMEDPAKRIGTHKTYHIHDFLRATETIHCYFHMDDATYLFYQLQLANTHLFSTIELLKDSVQLTKTFDCHKKTLTKRYFSLKELKEDDNKKEIEYDKEFDDTNYDILKVYAIEKKTMSNESFIEFLADKLVTKYSVSTSASEEMAKTIIRGKKWIQEGEYAILEIRPQLLEDTVLSTKEKKEIEIEADVRKRVNYYRRVKNVWLFDKDVTTHSFVDTNTLFCNLSNTCYKNPKTAVCESIEKESEIRIKKIAKEEIISEFSERNKEDLSKKVEILETKIRFYEEHLERVSHIPKHIFDFYALSLAQQMEWKEINESPHLPLRNLIFSSSFDFHRKQEMIIQMVKEYCREPLPTESPHWKYCKTSNMKLIEKSLYMLAIAFQNNEYNKVLQYLCKVVGEEEGEYIIDKFTGCELKTIEGREDSNDFFRTREFEDEDNTIDYDYFETNSSDVMLEPLKTNRTLFEPETQIYYNMLVTLCRKGGEGIDIDVESIQDVVLEICSSLSNDRKIFMGEKTYTFIHEEEKKKNTKKITFPTYKKYVSAKQLEIVSCATLLAIQCLIPSIKRRRTYPGCIQSFQGYPLDVSENLSSITYLACVLRKTAKGSDFSPWNTVPMKDNMMEARLKNTMEKVIIPHPIASALLIKKRLYEVENHTEDIPDTLNVSKTWLRFTPSIVPLSTKKGFRNVTKDFIEEWKYSMLKGKKEQWEKFGVLTSKIDLFSAGVIQYMNDIVKTQDALLSTKSNIPFLQNACCHDSKRFTTPLQFFMAEENEIKQFTEFIKDNSLLLNKYRTISKAFVLNEKPESYVITKPVVNRKNDYFQLSPIDIYKTVFYYCNMDHKTLPIPDELRGFVSEKLDGYDRDASIEEKIDFFEQNGKKQTVSKLIDMMNIIHRRNVITNAIRTKDDVSHVNEWRQVLDKKKPFVPESLYVFLDLFEKEEKTLIDDWTNFLEPEIVKMKLELRQFLEDPSQKLFTSAKVTLLYEKLFETETFLKTENGYLSYCSFIKQFLNVLCTSVPSYLIQKQTSSKQIPTHWGLTSIDSMSLQKVLTEFSNVFNMFHLDPKLSTLMKEVKEMLLPLKHFYHFFPQQEKVNIRWFQYLLLLSFILPIKLSYDPQIIKETYASIKHDMQQTESELPFLVPIQDTQQDIQHKLGELYGVYLTKCLKNTYDYSTLSYHDIKKKMEQLREQEKQTVKNYFKNMQKEERRVELIVKGLHLGKFNVDYQKLIRYGNDNDALFGAVVDDKMLDHVENDLLENEDDLGNDDLGNQEMQDVQEEEDYVDEDLMDINENAFEHMNDND